MTKQANTNGAAGVVTNVGLRSAIAMYEQIEHAIMFRIAAAALKGGDQIASIRDQAEASSINPNTVAKAYRDLEVMGLIYTRRGKGVYVAQGAKEIADKKTGEYLDKKLAEAAREAREAGWELSDVDAVVADAWKSKSPVY